MKYVLDLQNFRDLITCFCFLMGGSEDGLNFFFNKKIAKKVSVRSTGDEKMRITILLSGRGDRSKFKLLVLISQKRTIPDLDRKNRLKIVYAGDTSWIDNVKILDLLNPDIRKDLF